MNGALKNLVKNLKSFGITSMMKRKISIAFLLIALGVIARIWLYKFLPPAPNFHIMLAGVDQPIFMPADVFFIVATISLIAGRYLGGYFAFIVPFSVMAITDVFLGNNFIFLFTWSGFALLGFFGYMMQKHSFSKFVMLSIPSIIIYDLWTNFGCWLGWYSHNLQGLMLCYTLAIPFMLWHLISTTALLPIMAIPFERGETIVEPSKIEKYAGISSTALLMALSIAFLL